MKSVADGIRARGFRKWYEHRLIEAHLHLVTAFLCLITVLAAVEQGGPYRAWQPLVWLTGVTVGLGVVGAWNWRRYFTIMGVAGFMCERSSCPQCDAYGRFEVLYTGPRADPDGQLPDALRDVPILQVRCRKCAHEWRM